MAGILSLFGRKYEPMPGLKHTSWQTENKVLVQGGVTRLFSLKKTQQHLSSVVEIFDPYPESWQQKEVTGDTPIPGMYSAASASVNNDLYTFGGTDGNRHSNSLHMLKDFSQWVELCALNKRSESPMAKQCAGMVAFGDSLAVFGGYGIPHGPTSFIRAKDKDSCGWTNEFHLYNLTNGIIIIFCIVCFPSCYSFSKLMRTLCILICNI